MKKTTENPIVLRIFLVSLSLFFAGWKGLYSQNNPFTDSAAKYFSEIKIAAKENKNLWKTDLYGPLLLVDKQMRTVYANFSDSAKLLKKSGTIFLGKLPNEINIANTSLHWSGKNWAMVMLPLPADKKDRINLLAHESFHRAQSSLGFQKFNPENNHLDKKEGRIYLRLELEALRSALMSKTDEEKKSHLTNAFIFREHRQSIFPDADFAENLLELNEGVAEYTGVMMSGRDLSEMQRHFIASIIDFTGNPTYVRSFAYQTIPVYGFLLQQKIKDWNLFINEKTNLTDYFVKEFQIELPKDISSAAKTLSEKYNGKQIASEENEREEKMNKIKAAYKKRFADEPHLQLFFHEMNISFDPRNIMPLDDLGTVYPDLRITDVWGILTVTNGALLSLNWDKVTVSAPTKVEPAKVTGDGWTLELQNGYKVEKDAETGNYGLAK